jgi:sacsin
VLAKNVFEVVGERNAAVFPFIGANHGLRVDWMSPVGTGIMRPYFSKNETLNIMKVLLQWDAIIVESNPAIIDGLIAAEIEARFLTPHSVVQFLKLCPAVSQNIPKLITETPFGDKETLFSVLKYCVTPDVDLTQLDGLPLMLTQDGYVRVFNVQKPLFPPEFAHLLPNSASDFVDQDMWNILITDEDTPIPSVFRMLSISRFAQMLYRERPVDALYGKYEIECTGRSR